MAEAPLRSWLNGDGYESVAGLPKDVDLSGREMGALREALRRGAWRLRVQGRPQYSGILTTYNVAIAPRDVPEGWERTDNGWYDRARVVIADSVPQYSGSGAGTLAGHADSLLPENAETDALYRGMTYEEFTTARDAGLFGSRGDFNLLPGETGVTYFSKLASEAASYATEFAPWPFSPTPLRPAVVVRISESKAGTVLPHPLGVAPTERRVMGCVPFNAVDAVYVARPYIIRRGTISIIAQQGRPAREGGRISPSSHVAWSEEAKDREVLPL